MAFSPNGDYLATGSWDESVNLIEMNQISLAHKFKNIHTSIVLTPFY